jgi:hypothetical protein
LIQNNRLQDDFKFLINNYGNFSKMRSNQIMVVLSYSMIFIVSEIILLKFTSYFKFNEYNLKKMLKSYTHNCILSSILKIRILDFYISCSSSRPIILHFLSIFIIIYDRKFINKFNKITIFGSFSIFLKE